jgi:hypothetical protein
VSFPGLVGQTAYLQGLNSEAPTTLTLPWGASVTLGQQFFSEVSRFDPLAELSQYAGPTFIAEGTAKKFAAAHGGEHTVWQTAMDHAFNTASGVETLDSLIEATVSYFHHHRKV